MQGIGDYLSIDYSQKKLNTSIDNRTIDYSQRERTGNKYKLSIGEVDTLISQASHLIDDVKYMPFYYRKLYEIGADRFKQTILLAEKGNQPSRLFAKLLKSM